MYVRTHSHAGLSWQRSTSTARMAHVPYRSPSETLGSKKQRTWAANTVAQFPSGSSALCTPQSLVIQPIRPYVSLVRILTGNVALSIELLRLHRMQVYSDAQARETDLAGNGGTKYGPYSTGVPVFDYDALGWNRCVNVGLRQGKSLSYADSTQTAMQVGILPFSPVTLSH